MGLPQIVSSNFPETSVILLYVVFDGKTLALFFLLWQIVLMIDIVVENARVMVLAATNRPGELDEAILRRLPQAFEIGIPDTRERAAILKVFLKGEKVEENIDYDYIASLCDGCTGSDLLDICKKAAYFPIRELLDEEKKAGKKSPVSTLSHIYVCLCGGNGVCIWMLEIDSVNVGS